jgi:hypothetical protein
MSQETKQEGEFKLKTRKPKNLSKQDNITRVDFSTNNEEQEVTKIVIKEEKDAIQEQSTDESVLRTEQPKVELQEVVEGNETSVETNIDKVEEQIIEEIKEKEEQLSEYADKNYNQKQLPENIEKLVSFMEETGGTVEDYVRLNADYSNIDELTLLKEYYSKAKPHFDKDEIQFYIEDSFGYDEEIEDDRDIKRKKLLFKEEVSKAKEYLSSVKDKYYEEIKLKSNVSKEQKEASEFFNRYKKTEQESMLKHDMFKKQTKELFNNDFKGFEYSVGDKKFRYVLQDKENLVEKQSDINNFIGKFLDKQGNISDTKNYHKALFTAMNSDKIAQHFYEQGKADATKEIMVNSKNPTLDKPRQTSSEVMINGLKVKSVSGFDSSKLRIKTRKFNN